MRVSKRLYTIWSDKVMSKESPSQEYLTCMGVKTHNLKSIDVQFRLKKWTAITGVSGSGKSSLAFDTIYAEAQRRFLETLGTYERQFLQSLPQGEAEEYTNIPAAIALKQTNKSGDPRTTIASSTDLSDPLRSLFMSLMDEACAQCGNGVVVHTTKDLLLYLDKHQGHYLATVPISLEESASSLRGKDLLAEGYSRIYLGTKDNNAIQSLEEWGDKALPSSFELVLDRLSSGAEHDELVNRCETIWSQIKFSSRFSLLYLREVQNKNDVNNDSNVPFHVQPYCAHCKTHTKLIQALDLDWQSGMGACTRCQGVGNIPVLDSQKIIPSEAMSLGEGAIKTWSTPSFEDFQKNFLKSCKKNHISVDVPYKSLATSDKQWIWKEHIDPFFQFLEQERYKSSARILLAKFRKYVVCPACQGQRLGPIGLNARCQQKTFVSLFQDEIHLTYDWVKGIKNNPKYEKRLSYVDDIYKEVEKKCALLIKLGLGSTHLFRRCRTLSGGEYQRVLLTRVIGNGLTDALYILDEPSVGLGMHEIPTLVECLRELRDLGNTVIMVDHDRELIMSADDIIELGPEGGDKGGFLMERTRPVPLSCISAFKAPLPERKKINPSQKFFSKKDSLSLTNFSAHYCKNLFVEFGLGKLNVVTGPSGAGKSTLIRYGLQAALEKQEENGALKNTEANMDEGVGTWDKLEAPADFFTDTEILYVEQRAMYRSIVSVPATLLGIMDILRKQFSQTTQALEFGFTASDFSFNGKGGCETCAGRGVLEEDLFFLGKVEKICPECNGTRYRSEILKVLWKNKNISQWLNTNLATCLTEIGKVARIGRPLYIACQLGLGHISLGLPSSSMSGGEAQRLRIAATLSKADKRIFCTLDEPSRGLSEFDIGNLLQTLLGLNDQGHTFVVVEHHPLFESHAHHVIRMGPHGGAQGGLIVEREIC